MSADASGRPALLQADVVIPAGQQLSNGFLLGNRWLRGIVVPSGFEGTQIRFRTAVGNPNAPSVAPVQAAYLPLHDADGARMIATVAGGTMCGFYGDALVAAWWLMLDAANTQTAERRLTLVFGA